MTATENFEGRGGPPGENIAEKFRLLGELAERYGLHQKATELRDRERDAALGLLVLVVGEGKFGKSSLLNALAGKAGMAPVSRSAMTFKVDIFAHAGDDGEHAFVRTRSTPEGSRVTVQDARRMCADDERRSAAHAPVDGGAPFEYSVVETIWRLADYPFGPDLCLGDTPGLAQMLNGTRVLHSSVVRGLENAYVVVNESWVKWYHRADVVLWCVPANKIPAKETDATLRTLVERCHKTMIPVITKADIVGGRVDESRAQFSRRYGSLFGGAAPFVTACAGGREGFAEFGVHELRQHLVAMAAEARDVKRRAADAFLDDSLRDVEEILLASAAGAVGNLRKIARVADEVAGEALASYGRAFGQVRRREAEFAAKLPGLREVLLSLDGELDRHWGKIKGFLQLRPDAAQSQELLALAATRVRDFLGTDELLEELAGVVGRASDGLGESAARKVAHPDARLQTVRIDQSGQTWREAFGMDFHVATPQALPSRVGLPELQVRLPDTISVFWRDVRRFFGRPVDRTELSAAEANYIKAVGEEVRSCTAALIDAGRAHLMGEVGRPLAAAVDGASVKASHVTPEELAGTLARLDADVRRARLAGGKDGVAAPTFALQARFWTSVSPDEALARRVATDLLTPRLPSIRERAAAFPVPPARLFCLRGLAAYLRQQARAVEPPAVPEGVPGPSRRVPGPAGRRWRRFLSLGFADARLVYRFDAAACGRVVRARRWLLFARPLEESLQSRFEAWMAESDELRSLEDELNRQLSDTFRDSGLPAALSASIAQEFPPAFGAAIRESHPTRREAAVPALAWRGWVVSPWVPPGLVVLCSGIALATGAGLWGWRGLVLGGVAAAALGWLTGRAAEWHLRWRIGRELKGAACASAARAAGRVSEQLGPRTIDRAMAAVAGRISPRPLQRVLKGIVEVPDAP